MGKTNRALSPSELRTLQEERNEATRMLDNVKNERYGQGNRGANLDQSAVERQVKQLETKIREGSPVELRGANKDKMAKRAESLANQIKEAMPSRDEMRNLRDNPGAPFKNLKWEKMNANKISEWKQIQRRLEPGDPTASNIEQLRRKN